MEFTAQTHRANGGGHSYDEQSVVVLSGVDAIRKRPAMYIGSTGADGMHHLLFELVENAVDEFLAGHCRNISVVLHADGSCSVTDDGRGIPVALHPRENRPTAEILLTDLHSGGKFKGDAYYLSGGVHGLGLTCVNALSEWLNLRIWREGLHYSQQFRRGVPGSEAREPDATSRRGTSIRFRPDPEIFGGAQEFSHERVSARLRELAYLNSGVTLRIEDEREGLDTEYRSTSGLVGFVESVNRNRAVINQEPIRCRGARGEIVVEAALQWTTSYAEEIYGFVNSVRTSRGGSHTDGLTRALTAVINRHAAAHGNAGGEVAHSDVLEGLGAVLSVRAADPQFDSQAKSRLVSPEVGDAVESVVADALSGFFAEQSEPARRVLGRVLDAQHARLAARRMGTPARYSPQDMARSLEIYRKQFGIRSKNWHESCRWLTDDNLLSAHVEMCAVGPQARMLDVCCGSGIVGGSFAGRVGHKVGLDITPEMRALAGTRLDEVRAGSVYEMEFEDNSFDLVVTREVLHLLPQPSRPLSEILRVLRPGGQLIFGQTVPFGEADAAWMFRVFKKKQPLFCNNFLAEDLEQLLGECGFRNVEVREYLQWEDIDLWIDTHETSALHRQEIRELYYNAPDDVREVHPFEVSADGKIKDQWRWCIYSARKPE
ncbi:MAG TPA: methyltransferase domain-containing protein [Pyrinomonadaceae bacterium]|nr:methyltransferase domain-containing protein [Pyrinomonadaceae bacterium]